MDWNNKTRETLIPAIENLDKLKSNPQTKKQRKKILTKYDYRCRFCSGKYLKYLLCFQTKNGELDICCRLCYIITHLNFGFINGIEIYCSELSQLDIVRKTVDYIFEHDDIPSPTKIDKNITESPISIFEYTNMLIKKDKSVDLSKFKIFIKDNMDITFIINNANKIKPMFVDSDKLEEYENVNIDDSSDSEEIEPYDGNIESFIKCLS